MPTKDKQKQREWSRLHYQKNKDSYLQRNRRYKAELKEKVDKIKSQPCTDCKQTYPPFVMEFHHTEPSTKEGNVGQLVYRGSVKRTMAEIEKCVLLCANCHRIREHGTLSVPQNNKTVSNQ